MKWAEVKAKKVNIRLPDFDLTLSRGETYYFSEQDLRSSEYLMWAVRQEKVDLRWVGDMSDRSPPPPNYKRLRGTVALPSQAAKGNNVSPDDLGSLMAELVVKTDAARKEQRDLFAALLARQEQTSEEIGKLSGSINQLAEVLILFRESQSDESISPEIEAIVKQVEGNGVLIQSVLDAVSRIRSSVPMHVADPRTVSSNTDLDEDEIRFIPTSEPSRIGEVNLDIEEQESEADVGDAMAALRRQRTKKK